MGCLTAWTKANIDCDKLFNCSPDPVMGSLCIACAKVTPIFLGVSAFFFQSPCLCKAAINGCIVTQLPVCAIGTLNSINGLRQQGNLRALPSQPKIAEEENGVK